MFFDPAVAGMKPEPFRFTVYNALVVPRPIGWISTISPDGVINLAPFSFFNALSGNPPCVMFCPNGVKPGTDERKDSLTNVEATGEFVYNMCTTELGEAMVRTAVHEPASIDEMAAAGLEAVACEKVRPPRVGQSPIALECKYLQTVTLPKPQSGPQSQMVIGQVIGIHVSEDVIADGIIDVRRMRPLARLGYLDYATIEPENVFSLRASDNARFDRKPAE